MDQFRWTKYQNERDVISKSFRELFQTFFKEILSTLVLFVRPLIPLFRLLVTSGLGFKARMDPLHAFSLV